MFPLFWIKNICFPFTSVNQDKNDSKWNKGLKGQTKVNKACLNVNKCLFLVKVVYNSLLEAYLSTSFHDPFSSSHLSPVAIRMTETLVSTEKVEAVDEFGDNSQPRHVLFKMVFFFWDQEQGVLWKILVIWGCAGPSWMVTYFRIKAHDIKL